MLASLEILSPYNLLSLSTDLPLPRTGAATNTLHPEPRSPASGILRPTNNRATVKTQVHRIAILIQHTRSSWDYLYAMLAGCQ